MSSLTFNKIKTFLWPIYPGEYKKFLPMFFIFFLISFNYSLLHTVKDAIVVTAPSSGAETLVYIKVWVLLPVAFLIAFILSKISNKHTTEKVFYLMVSIFLTFYALFIFVLYPNRDFLHPTAFAQKLEQILPLGMHGLVALIRNWTYTLFYVMSELWGTTILSVLFWGFANEVTPIPQAKRFYSLFGVSANLATMLSGQVTIYLSSLAFNPKIPIGSSAWDQSLFFILTSVIVIGLLLIFLFRHLNLKVISKETENKELFFKAKVKNSIRQNFSYLMKSRYLILIAVIVLCYNITINLAEILWKNQLNLLYPNAADYNAYMGKVFIFIGLFATITAFFISGNLLRRFNWTLNALISPIIILVAGFFFFSYFLLKGPFLNNFALLFGMAPLALSVFFGSMQNSLARICKFTFFDATKEIAFIPLDRDTKIQGKAAIDGVASRMGKTGGSIIYTGLLLQFSTIAASASYIALIFLIIMLIWMISVRLLGKEFNALTAQKETATKLTPATEAVEVNK